MDVFELKQHFYIESARKLTKLPSTHPCSQIHGHSFKIVLTLRGTLDPEIEWVRDYHEIKSTAETLFRSLDHKVLNTISGLENPTSENLCRWIYKNLKLQIKELYQVTIMETTTTECTYPIYGV